MSYRYTSYGYGGVPIKQEDDYDVTPYKFRPAGYDQSYHEDPIEEDDFEEDEMVDPNSYQYSSETKYTSTYSRKTKHTKPYSHTRGQPIDDEFLDDDFEDDVPPPIQHDRSRRTPGKPNYPPGNYLSTSTRSLKNNFISLSDKPSKSSFYTTVTLHQPQGTDTRPAIIQKALLHFHAEAKFIHRSVVDLKNLIVHRLPNPAIFEAAAGETAAHDEMAHFTLYLGGIPHTISAYVDDSSSKAGSTRLLLGEPAVNAFRLERKYIGVGAHKRVRVTVTPDVTGFRRRHFVVARDPARVRTRAFLARRGDEMLEQVERPMGIPEVRARESGRRRGMDDEARRANRKGVNWVYGEEW